MDQKKVALFIDMEHVYRHLKAIYNSDVDAALLVEKARSYGALTLCQAYGDFTAFPAELRQSLTTCGIRSIQVDTFVEQQFVEGQLRDVIKDGKDLEILADIFEALNDNPAITTILIATGSRQAARAVALARNKFGKEVVICGVERAIARELEIVATCIDPITVAAQEPESASALAELVALVESLEQRKRYLNFKFIRDNVLRSRAFDCETNEEADGLLAEGIDCGLIVKRKIEDKYNPGQFFTAYALNRESVLYDRYRREESAEEEADEGELEDRDDSLRAVPRYGSR